jgi:hypothetical protein
MTPALLVPTLVSVLALLVSIATFIVNVLIRVDDLKLLMVPNWPTMTGNRQQVTITSSPQLAFLNMGNRPIAVAGIDFFVDGVDVKEVQIQPFIVDAGKVLTKELSPADGTVTFNPAEKLKLSENQTIKLGARFSLVTPDGFTVSSIDLHSELSLPPSGVTGVFQYSVVPPVGTARVTEPVTLYHHRALAVFW